MRLRKSLSVLCIAMSVWMTTGCATSKQSEPEPFQQNLLVKCPPHLSPHPGGKDGESLIKTLGSWVDEYSECAERHNALVDAHNKERK